MSRPAHEPGEVPAVTPPARLRVGDAETRLGLYIDAVYHREPDLDSAPLETMAETLPFLLLACETGRHFGQLVLFGRRAEDPSLGFFVLPGQPDLVALPHYDSLRDTRALARSMVTALRELWKGVARADTIIAFGPHPFALALVVFSRLRRRRVLIGVRQDTMRYFASRLPSRAAAPVLAPLWVLDRIFRILARRIPAVVVGDYLEQVYGGPRDGLLNLRPSLVPATAVAASPPERELHDRVRVLTVGRIEPEKNPLLAVEALAELDRRFPGRFHLTWIGVGRLRDAMLERARALGVEHAISLPGFVPFGPVLLEMYADADLFLHTARTEAFGQVLIEAMSAGTPVVATDVGGVAAVLEHGAAGVLVPADDAAAIVSAVVNLSNDAALRRRLAERGLSIARGLTIEAEAIRLARFIRRHS